MEPIMVITNIFTYHKVPWGLHYVLSLKQSKQKKSKKSAFKTFEKHKSIAIEEIIEI